MPDAELRKQALASIGTKRFHADGGCVYAAVRTEYAATLVRVIVALQTISDYLDNLCDRCEQYDGQDFHQLHHAMRDAVVPGAPVRDYYAFRQMDGDGGYLEELVLTCQRELATLPGYAKVQESVQWLVERYCELQVHKHIEPSLRTERLMAWWKPYAAKWPDLYWWEFAAATGSTLGMFALFLSATREPDEIDAESVFAVYFPWIGGLHILLDYLIDLDEDAAEGDYNFIARYPSPALARERIEWFVRQSLHRCEQSPSMELQPRIHTDVVRGLLGMYLSDRKVVQQPDVRPARRLVWQFGPLAWLYYSACVLYRKVR